jgi:protein O-GlcNAc transferase
MPEPDLLDFAIRALKTNDMAGAEVAARLILDDAPQDAAALHLLGVIAARVQAFDAAEAYFTRALAAEPDNAQIAQNLAAAQHQPRPRLASGDRFLLIREWGFGFWSDVSHTLGALLLAEATGRIPVTWWGKDSLFSDGADRDAFQLYFQPVSDVMLQDLPNSGFFPPRWNAGNLKTAMPVKWQARTGPVYFLNRPERVAVLDFFAAVPNVMAWLPPDHPMHGEGVEAVYRYLTDKYLHPKPDITAACDAFFDRELKGAPFVAAHLRGGDKFKEDRNAHAVNQQILSQLEQTDDPVLLLTDDVRCLDMASGRFGDRIVATDCQRSNQDQGVHLLPTTERVQAGREAMVDAYLASRAMRFIGNGLSNVSAMIAVLKHWPAGACTLMGPSILSDRSFALYRKKAR